jgi:hypothetical protein
MLIAGAAMQLSELLRAISAVAQTGGTPALYEALGREAERLADMVGWANGPIDPNGQLLERLASLQDDLSVRHAQTQETTLMLLHDALTGLGRAIARHDEDLDGCGDSDVDGEDLM